MMKPHYHDDSDLFRQALSFTESETGFSARLVEKDYYCSILLCDLFAAEATGSAFKGGTCLSKVHCDFYRMSEDLDFALSLPVDATRSQRSKRVTATKAHLVGLPKRIPCFRIVDALQGYNNSTQYIGRVCYQSCVTGQEEYIKVEFSVREPIWPTFPELRRSWRRPRASRDWTTRSSRPPVPCRGNTASELSPTVCSGSSGRARANR